MTGSWLLCVTASAILSVCIIAARGEVCTPPNVPRVVIDMRPAGMTLAVNRPILWNLTCPTQGPCQYIADLPAPSQTVICLTPAEEAEAEARGK